MTLHVDPIEVLWLVVNIFTLVMTFLALVEALTDLKLARTDSPQLQDRAREITTVGNVRRELLRVIVQLLLLSLVFPGLFSDNPISLSPFIIALILIAIVLLTSTLFDSRDRGKLIAILVEIAKTRGDKEAADGTSTPV
jgi:hypothetical protein